MDVLTTNDVTYYATKIKGNWKKLAPHLNLKPKDIREIAEDSDDVVLQVEINHHQSNVDLLFREKNTSLFCLEFRNEIRTNTSKSRLNKIIQSTVQIEKTTISGMLYLIVTD